VKIILIDKTCKGHNSLLNKDIFQKCMGKTHSFSIEGTSELSYKVTS